MIPTLGTEIRAARNRMGMTLAQVAQLSDLSASFLSQLERGITTSSLSTLKRIADVLNIPAGKLMFGLDGQNPEVNSALVKRANRKSIAFPESNIRYELLTPDLRKKASILWLYAPPGSESGNPFFHEGEDGVILLKGTLEVGLKGEWVKLELGDSIYFDSQIPHQWRNTGTIMAEAIWISTPPSF